MSTNNNQVENRLWGAADELRANSKLKALEYSIPMDIEGDAFGRIYEYFLGNFDFVMANPRPMRRRNAGATW